MEAYAWTVVLAAWSLLLLVGLAGGDPLEAGQPRLLALAVALARRVARVVSVAGARRRIAPAPRRRTPHRPGGTGLAAAA